MSREYVATLSECLRLFLPPGGSPRVVKGDDGVWTVERPAVKPIQNRWVMLTPEGFDYTPSKTAVRQRQLIEALQCGPVTTRDLNLLYNNMSATIKALEKRGVVVVEERRAWRGCSEQTTLSSASGKALVALTNGQQQALAQIERARLDAHGDVVLVDGVTGSGKTEVYLSAIERVLAAGRSACVLVPEISLTPQTVSLFCSFYGERVAVLHSSLSAGQRHDAYRRIAAGEVDLVIGTRSAVFAPLPNLGMIVIDEEQEHTYKSDMSPKYHARDVAAFRIGRAKGLLLLASSTPSVESYYKARSGQYALVELTERYGHARLPEVYIDAMRKNALGGNLSPFGALLTEKMSETLSRGEQAILFLNRRGYNAFLTCRDCGEAVLCPRCSVSLTRHKERGRDYLLCHYCGYRSAIPHECPSCHSAHLAFMGYGTQKVEEAFGEKFGGAYHASLLRMDADTTTKKSAYDELLGAFRAHKADVLLGTQMVAKGHDFPDVTLVGVLNADAALYLDDFRAGERTFSMLTQVIGRAGPAENRGDADIQTMNTPHEVISLTAAQDYRAFYARDFALREAFTFPPFCDIAVISAASASEAACTKCAAEIFTFMKDKMSGDYRDVPVISFGPFEAPLYKIEDCYRMRVVLKCRRSKRLLAMLGELLRHFTTKDYKAVSVGVDINPTNL